MVNIFETCHLLGYKYAFPLEFELVTGLNLYLTLLCELN